MKTVRVLIVEDSPVAAALLEAIIEADPRLEVVASVSSGERALACLQALAPDVISMDVHLPGLDGLATTRQIMQLQPTPIVIVSQQTASQDQLNFNALKAGALTVLDKPVGPAHPQFAQQAQELCTQLLIMSQVKVVRQRQLIRIPGVAAPPPESFVPQSLQPFKLLALVASTGGPKALVTLFNALGPAFPLPVLVVQHITPSFFEGFVSWLDSVVPLPVKQAQHQQEPKPGEVYLAPPEAHLTYRWGQMHLTPGADVSYQCPSGTVLLESLASHLGPRALGVVLTGMGNDGASGLLSLRQAGGYTLAEAESTAVVYGMPAVAAQLNAACEILPLPEIAPRICHLLTSLKETQT